MNRHLLYIVDTIDRVFDLFPTSRQFWNIKEYLEQEEQILEEPVDCQTLEFSEKERVSQEGLNPMKTVRPLQKEVWTPFIFFQYIFLHEEQFFTYQYFTQENKTS